MRASATLSKNLQSVLVDLLELQLQSKQIHWNVVGTNFRDLHRQLDEINHEVRLFADQMAERMRALEATPDGRSVTVSATTSLDALTSGELSTADAVGVITDRLQAVVGTCRDVHDQVDEEDPTTADILHVFIEKLEQFAWMVSAENRTPQTVKGASAKGTAKGRK